MHQLEPLRGFHSFHRQRLNCLLDSVNHRVVRHARHSFDGAEAHAIEREFQAVLFDRWQVALWGVSFTKLTTTTAAEIVFNPLASSVLDSLVRLTVETLHRSSGTLHHTSIVNA